MNKVGFIFPGQGSQSTGMGHDLYDNIETSKDVFERANSILNKKISDICFNGPDEELRKTINAQVAIVTTSIAALEAFRSKSNIKPAITLGHSLGEYCAMYCAYVMDLSTTIKAIQRRSELMDEATKLSQGAMSAVLGADIELIKKCINDASSFGLVEIANYNNPSQIVITGEVEAVNKAGEFLKAQGVRKVISLAVSGGFHSKLMTSARDGFVDFVKNLDLKDAKIPVITNVDAEFTKKADEFRAKMPNQINHSVMWLQSIQKAVNEGVDTFVEFGNGKVLAGLNAKISPDIKTYNVFDTNSLNETIAALEAQAVVI
ncbi:MAG: ACP S-malonyltransferase [Candidatus Gastranaerophilales bacterium]|nr:ACP S-malonyltransferase [Candidatus Gastranaerophilales bacterium]